MLPILGLGHWHTPTISGPQAPITRPRNLPYVPPKMTLVQFCDAVRAKDRWTAKILDQRQNLSIKWATEAGLLDAEGPTSGADEPNSVLLALEDLKAEARRIWSLDYKVSLDSGRFLPSQIVDISGIDGDIRNALKYMRGSKHAIQAPSLAEEVGVFVSDGLTPPGLHRALVAELDALAAIEPKDFHPGSDGKVQDLIHPSLYPFVAGSTQINESSEMPLLTEGKFRTEMVVSQRITLESSYSWIPSIFRVSDDGRDVHIESYINGLGPRERYPRLYTLIEKVFLLALPHLERTMDFEYIYKSSPSVDRWVQRSALRERTTKTNWDSFLARQKEQKDIDEMKRLAEDADLKFEIAQERMNPAKFFGVEDSIIESPWKGQELKVIVKAANYVLKPGQEYEGTWHMEGMPHERIVSSMIYYYDTDPQIIDQGLALRRLRDGDIDFPSTDEYMHESFDLLITEKEPSEDDQYIEPTDTDYPSDWEQEGGKPMSTSSMGNYIQLGVVPTTNFTADPVDLADHGTGRMITFPNWIQHKVENVRNGATDATSRPYQVATRKILCFFLVNDDNGPRNSNEISYHGFFYSGLQGNKVLTTNDIPSQERACNTPTLHYLLSTICDRLIGKNLPAELISHIIDEMGATMTRETAERHRRQLMEDRKIKQPGEWHPFWDYTYSLCEH